MTALESADSISAPWSNHDALPLPGTEGGSHPFFSPDGHWVGFFAEGKLKKTSIDGGKVLTLAEAPAHRGHAQLAGRNAPGPE